MIRYASDKRDRQEHGEVMAILSELPPDHPAREAYAHGASTLELARLVADRAELIERLREAFLAGYRRMLASTNTSRPS